jgi:hypothetical protein
MPDPPKRFKEQDELDGDELVKVVQARAANAPQPRFETADYKEYRRDVLREGGLIDEADELEAEQIEGKPLEEMSPGEHFDRIRGGLEGRF